MGKKKRRGRPRCPRNVDKLPEANLFKPRGIPAKDLEVIEVSTEEIEAIRLTDLEKMNQQEAAEKMGVSRKTFWKDLKSARKKITEALVTGKAISIKEGNIELQEKND